MARTFKQWEAKAESHALWEDAFGITVGVTLVALAVTIYQHLGMVTGGVPGLALSIHYLTGIELGLAFFLINVPFYALAIARMGWSFTLKTLAAVSLRRGSTSCTAQATGNVVCWVCGSPLTGSTSMSQLP